MNIQPILKLIHKAEDSLLVAALATMLGTAILQIILRNFFDSGIFWAESFLRILVLWLAMLGAMVATREANHISIDAFSRYLKPSHARWTNFFINIFSAAICTIVTYYSLEFVGYEYEDQTIAFAKVPTWICQSIIPLGFAVMAFRFVINGFRGVIGAEK